MSEPDTQVECAQHGHTAATFVCRHLQRGVGCGFHDAEVDGDPWPDAWCDQCQRVLDRDGAWTDDNAPELALLCTGCYEEARARNRHVPAPIRPGQLALSDEEYAAFAHAAHAWCSRLQETARARWAFDTRKRWRYDRDARLIRFFDGDDGPAVVADVALVGSWSSTSRTWLWVWGNETCDGPEAARVGRVRVFGEVRGVRKLADAHWDAAEMDGWEVTQIAAYLLDDAVEAVYRAPIDHLQLFMHLKNFRSESARTAPRT